MLFKQLHTSSITQLFVSSLHAVSWGFLSLAAMASNLVCLLVFAGLAVNDVAMQSSTAADIAEPKFKVDVSSDLVSTSNFNSINYF